MSQTILARGTTMYRDAYPRCGHHGSSDFVARRSRGRTHHGWVLPRIPVKAADPHVNLELDPLLVLNDLPGLDTTLVVDPER